MAVAAAARQLCAHVASSYSSRSSGVGESSQAVWKGLAFVAQCSGSSLSLRASNYAAAGHVMLPKRVTMNQLGVVEREGTGQVSSAKAAQIDSVQQQPNAATFNPTFSSIVEKAVNKSTHAGPFSVQKVLSFVKYQGLGNDFLLVDNRDSMEPKISEEEATRLCDRNFGVGGDGVIFLMPGVNGSDYSMRIFNSDGSEPEMCGNGIRCLARFIAELENTTEPRSYNVHTLAGAMILKLREDGQVVVDMGPPILNPAHIPTKLSPTKDGAVVQAPLVVDGKTWSVTCVSMGNPHCVTYGEQGSQNFSVEELPLSHLGPLFENHEVFPARINTHFVEALSRSHVRMRVWERGAGPTLACGTGACALVVAGVLEGRIERACTVDLPGGPLEIEWNEKDNHVYMTGPGTAVFSGKAFL